MLRKIHLKMRIQDVDFNTEKHLRLTTGFLPAGKEDEIRNGLIKVIETYLADVDAHGEFVVD